MDAHENATSRCRQGRAASRPSLVSKASIYHDKVKLTALGRFDLLDLCTKRWAAISMSNPSHKNRAVSWQMSIPRSRKRSLMFLSDTGNCNYVIRCAVPQGRFWRELRKPLPGDRCDDRAASRCDGRTRCAGCPTGADRLNSPAGPRPGHVQPDPMLEQPLKVARNKPVHWRGVELKNIRQTSFGAALPEHSIDCHTN